MSELYKGMPGSPITYLASDITAGQTTISVADDTALPDAPNICTIGYGEELETIKYGTKSNGVLQNVTRGIEGAPRTWQAGTEVARFYTAYEHNRIIDNIEAIHQAHLTHLEESANTPEIISNSSGTAYKFPSGLMIWTRLEKYTVDVVEPDNNVTFVYQYTVRFAETPVISVSVGLGTNSTYTKNYNVSYHAAGTNENSVTAVLTHNGLSTSRGSPEISVYAIGRWK